MGLAVGSLVGDYTRAGCPRSDGVVGGVVGYTRAGCPRSDLWREGERGHLALFMVGWDFE